MKSWLRCAAVFGVAALLMAACGGGSGSKRAGRGVSDDEQGVSEQALTAGADRAGGREGVGPSSGGEGRGTAGTGAAPGQSATGAQAGAVPLRNCTVTLGISYVVDLAAALAVLGYPQAAGQVADEEEARRAYEVGIEWINRNGGINGCKVKAVYFEWKSSGDWQAQSQEECSYFTEDHDVFAILPSGNERRVLLECAAKKGVPVFYHYEVATPDMKRYRGMLYQPNLFDSYRVARPAIDALAGSGFFGKATNFAKGSKVGIFWAEDAEGYQKYQVDKIIKPRLEKMGIKVVMGGGIKPGTGVGDVGDSSQTAQPIVLKFKNENVDHVICPWSCLWSYFIFSPVAESQQYRPWYGLLGSAALSSQEQYKKTWLVDGSPYGWDGTLRSTEKANSGFKKCEEVYAESGRFAVWGGTNLLCSRLFFLQQTLRGKSKLSAQSLLAGAEALGTSFVDPNSYGATRFGPGRYDGARIIATRRCDPDNCTGAQPEFVRVGPHVDIG